MVELYLAETIAESAAPACHGVVLGNIGVDPFIGQFGQQYLLHFGDGYFEISWLLCSVGDQRELEFFADRGTNELIVKATGDPTLSNFVEPVFSVQANDRFAIARAL